jgi:hypothetical protein
MQTKIIAAIVVASIIITTTSCDWFTNNNPSKNLQTNLIGKWKIDSIYQEDTSTQKNGLPGLVVGLMALSTTDSSYSYQFNSDSTWYQLSTKDSSLGKYYVKDSLLFFEENNAFVPNKIITLNDSLLSFSNEEKLVIRLKKQSAN